MAYANIRYKNQLTGRTREAPRGFSWTVLFFGPLPPLFRGDWKWFAIIFLIGAVTLGASNFVFCFIYNDLYIKDLLNDGYNESNRKINNKKQFYLKKFTLEQVNDIKKDVKKDAKKFSTVCIYFYFIINVIALFVIGFSWQTSIGFIIWIILASLTIPILREKELSKSLMNFSKKYKIIAGFIVLIGLMLTTSQIEELIASIGASESYYENDITNKVEIDSEILELDSNNSMLVKLMIGNYTTLDIYNIDIECSNYSFFGTDLGKNKINIYDIVKARSNRLFNNINIENVNKDTYKTKCIVSEYKNVEMI